MALIVKWFQLHLYELSVIRGFKYEIHGKSRTKHRSSEGTDPDRHCCIPCWGSWSSEPRSSCWSGLQQTPIVQGSKHRCCVGHVPWFCPGWAVPHPLSCVPWAGGSWGASSTWGCCLPANARYIPRRTWFGECSYRVNCYLFLLHFTSLQQSRCCFLNKGLNP